MFPGFGYPEQFGHPHRPLDEPGQEPEGHPGGGGGRSFFYSSSVSETIVRLPDGSVERRRTERLPDGTEKTTVSRTGPDGNPEGSPGGRPQLQQGPDDLLTRDSETTEFLFQKFFGGGGSRN